MVAGRAADQPDPYNAKGGTAMTTYDLTHRLEAFQPSYPTHARYYRMLWSSLAHGDRSTHAQLILGEHSGTHVDAPSHFVEQGQTIDQIPLDRFMGPAHCLDCTDLAAGDRLESDRLEAYDRQCGPVESGDIVLFHYGWDRYWGVESAAKRYTEGGWPGLSEGAARWLVARRVQAVGTDAISIDSSTGNAVVAHQVLLPGDVLVYENLCGLDQVVGRRFQFVGMPLKIGDGTGSPVRAFASMLT